MAEKLESPWQLLAGPWAHKLPDRGIPGPKYPFLDEMARFFHQHLEAPAPAAIGRPRTAFFIGRGDSPMCRTQRSRASGSGRRRGRPGWSRPR